MEFGTKYIFTGFNPYYDEYSYITRAIENNGLNSQLKDELDKIARSSEALSRSPKFTELCLRRLDLTGKLNIVIAGEMVHEIGKEFIANVTAEGLDLRTLSGEQRLPYDGFGGRDGDFIDGVWFGRIKIAKSIRKMRQHGFRINRNHRKSLEKLVTSKR